MCLLKPKLKVDGMRLLKPKLKVDGVKYLLLLGMYLFLILKQNLPEKRMITEIKKEIEVTMKEITVEIIPERDLIENQIVEVNHPMVKKKDLGLIGKMIVMETIGEEVISQEKENTGLEIETMDLGTETTSQGIGTMDLEKENISQEKGSMFLETETISRETKTMDLEIGTTSQEIGIISQEIGTISQEIGTMGVTEEEAMDLEILDTKDLLEETAMTEMVVLTDKHQKIGNVHTTHSQKNQYLQMFHHPEHLDCLVLVCMPLKMI
ncbi:hypothetical protein NCER_101593 [Vairimorpha ceranae BRL01]|uniref:Uncharacterized protein n=1 Tax=Vairimorpha ceranae (strain BRL01) TaxID=578460 RepID=C4VAD1_VAIC1|nr:hypothetical protein NCER_101593 [Vairimorpha ceranae BRL01]